MKEVSAHLPPPAAVEDADLSKKVSKTPPQPPQKDAGDDSSLIRIIARNSNRKVPAHEHRKGKDDTQYTRHQLMHAFIGEPRKTEEDEYLEASSREEEDIAAPWMEGSVICTVNQDVAVVGTVPPHEQDISLIGTSVAKPDELFVHLQTFIKVDTNIQSNDPKSKVPIPDNVVDDNEATPKAKYGMLQGCLRDKHMKHGILYFSNIIFLFAWWIKSRQWNANDCTESNYYKNEKCSGFFGNLPGLVIFVFCLMLGLFLLEFFCSSTGKYLRNINKTEDIMDYMGRMYKTAPTLSIKIELYHYETRVVHYTDSNGNSSARTESYPVVTYTEHEQIYIASWSDVSIPLEHEEIKEFEVTKLKVHKTFTGDQNFQEQCEDLIARNRHRDHYYNFYTFYEIDGYKSRVLAFVDLDKRPKSLSFKWCLWAHLTLFASLPYRIWMSSITGKVDTTVHKNICTLQRSMENLCEYPKDEETGNTEDEDIAHT